jgi:hypothetical protein
MQANKYMLDNTCLSEMSKKGLPLEEIGPFLSDQQHEAGSKGMMDAGASAGRRAERADAGALAREGDQCPDAALRLVSSYKYHHVIQK